VNDNGLQLLGEVALKSRKNPLKDEDQYDADYECDSEPQLQIRRERGVGSRNPESALKTQNS
jgi:hypothetical protein